MKLSELAVLAAVVLVAMPAYAAREIDCEAQSPTQAVQFQSEGTMMSADLMQKRRQAREADLARLRERFARASSAAQPVAPAQQAAR